MNDALILIHEVGKIATITLNRPQYHNALDDCLIAQLSEQLKAIAHRKDIDVVLIQANGKSFCAGADLNWMQRIAHYSEKENIADSMKLSELLQTLYQLPQVSIALVQGAAYGGGIGLVASCDIAIATESARFCFSEVKLGLIPAIISPYVIAAMGERITRRYFLTAEMFNAEQALRYGLISQIITAKTTSARCDTGQQLAQHISNNSPDAIRQAKQLIQQQGQLQLDDNKQLALAKQLAMIRRSEQGQEGMRAFLEKRTPSWQK